jgi:shikimate kinase
MIVLIIGPSAVGKSAYAEYAAGKVPGCCFFDLDKLVGQRAGIRASELLCKVQADGFLECCQREVDVLRKSCTHLASLVAVGAGALESPRAGAWLSQHHGPTIAIVAPPHEVYERGGLRNQGRDLAQFTRTEYSPYRLSLYSAARYQCDVKGLTLEDARTRFTDMVRSLLPEGEGRIGA